tara:strand:+ start:81 stop:2051 length:1971 start_codon:yes stop_codon:yes gene_type:complete
VNKRKYNKKSPYWEKFSKASKEPPKIDSIPPIFAGDSYYTESQASFVIEAMANRNEPIATRTNRRSHGKHKESKKDKYSNIREGLLPYDVSGAGISIRESVELCQKAYANISIFRNAIDVMSEFANSEIQLKGGNSKSRDFIYKWFERINLWKVRDQYFREYYKSGNIFMYRVDGKFTKDDFSRMSKVYGGIDQGKIPIKYIFLNPYDIMAQRSTTFNQGQYFKVLSEYDLERLANPKSDYDQQVFDGLPQEIKKSLTENSYPRDGVKIPLPPENIIHSFYKKQDYEPFAIPFGFPVLDDINYKIELKKIDQAICRTIENVILLITMGAEPEKGGINPRNLEAMQKLFQNESVGRVLVSDYTTKADFVIPDLRKVVGPDKYQIVNQDIREGLQNIIVGDERYSNTQVKAEIFLERLKESRNAFLNDFLQEQIKMVCKSMGFKQYPTAHFEEIDIKDEVQLQRVATRLIELGILTPEQGINAIKSGVYPQPEELGEAQDAFVEKRKQGHFNPLVGGVPMIDGDPASGPSEVGRPPGSSGIPQQNQSAEQKVSRQDIQKIIYNIETLGSYIKTQLKEKYGCKRLNKQQVSLAEDLCESIICSSEIDSWESLAEACISDNEKIATLDFLPEVLDISETKQLAVYPSALYYHSKRRQDND